MPSQGTFSGAGDRAFGLIETFRWSRQDGFSFFAEHMRRLETSADALGFAFDRVGVLRQLTDFVSALGSSTSRVRLVLSRDGGLKLSATALADGPTPAYLVGLAEPRHPSNDIWLRHKTTMRDRYEVPLAAQPELDEILFLNERDELCEGARTNIFVMQDGHLLTPALSCGLLPGTFRAHLLDTGQAREAVLGLADLTRATEWFLGNSVRNLVPARLVAS